MSQPKIVVSKDARESQDNYDIIYSNITFINLIREEVETEDPEEDNVDELIPHDAFLSYYVDYYLSQYENGNFSQFVYNTGADLELIDWIIEGLEKMGSVEHLALLKKRLDVLENMDEAVLEAFIESDYFGTNPTRDILNDDDFFKIEEDLIELNANWLKQHSELLALSIDEMYDYAEQLLGKKVERE
ncbi:DUF4375 domain-containing protein [Myroides sp. DF42-4-2]|uniref:DMP19 family protein n=1 Tax=unclassified Myroides TaxID=2642485 RepID=UPI0025766D0C|nr:DUF4375 domain-containing protein [Myroides sp. DF42-4-2]MDM1407370.1 DUF4375 domain-containing protein [Myroides sp. DF42-4-2]